MPFPAGTQVVDRDRAVLSALAIARYLTIDQLSRLIFAGRNERVARRRLNRLSQPGPGKLDPLVRAVAYRSATGAPLKAWALTEAGYALAKRFVPYAPAPRKDVGPAFMEHTLLLNDVFVGLAVKVLGAGERAGRALTELPFRWVAESGEYVSFEYYDRHAQSVAKGRIRPDATLEIGAPPRRLFLECETGAHTLVSSDPTSTGATNAKIQRYAHLLAGAVGQHDAKTPYAKIFPDAAPATLVFLVHSERRRDAIRKLVAEPAKSVRIAVRALTFAEAVSVLAAAVRGVPGPADQRRVASVATAELDLLETALAAAIRVTATRGERLGRRGDEPGCSERHREAVREAARLVARLRTAARPDREADSLPAGTSGLARQTAAARSGR